MYPLNFTTGCLYGPFSEIPMGLDPLLTEGVPLSKSAEHRRASYSPICTEAACSYVASMSWDPAAVAADYHNYGNIYSAHRCVAIDLPYVIRICRVDSISRYHNPQLLNLAPLYVSIGQLPRSVRIARQISRRRTLDGGKVH